MKKCILTKEEIENRRKAVNEAIGLNIMAGSTPSKEFNDLIEKYISGEKSLEEIELEIDKIYSFSME